MNKIEPFLTEKQIAARVRELGKKITEDYSESENYLAVVAILKGSVVFLSDLIRRIKTDISIDFMTVSSYGSGTSSSGSVKIIKDLDINIENRDVLVVEDILDSGHTLSKVIEILKTRNPKSIKICALLDKPDRREVQIDLDYRGFEIPDKFLVGYGLDFAEKYRNLPYIAVLYNEAESDLCGGK